MAKMAPRLKNWDFEGLMELRASPFVLFQEVMCLQSSPESLCSKLSPTVKSRGQRLDEPAFAFGRGERRRAIGLV